MASRLDLPFARLWALGSAFPRTRPAWQFPAGCTSLSATHYAAAPASCSAPPVLIKRGKKMLMDGMLMDGVGHGEIGEETVHT
ncbi:hypothetical protein DFH27DRAFT_616802 [Peziza echinospora]|nr:hypothetical protein DFH27DRAFT_616802 [Peziza echinospora]